MVLKELPLINVYPTLTPMEENRSSLEATITALMLFAEIKKDPSDEVSDALLIASAAISSAAES